MDLTWDEVDEGCPKVDGASWAKADAEDILLHEEEGALMGIPKLLELTRGWSKFTQHRFGIPEGKG